MRNPPTLERAKAVVRRLTGNSAEHDAESLEPSSSEGATPASRPPVAVDPPPLSIEEFRRRHQAGELSVLTWQQHGISPDGFIGADLDPHSPEYARAVAATWSAITGRSNYVAEVDETLDLSGGDYQTRPYPFSSGQPTEVARYLGVVAATLERIGRPLPATVLELGSGWGHLALALASTGFKVTAVDLSPASTALLSHRRDALGLGNDLEVVCAGFLDFEPAGPVDVIVFFESFHHCERPFELLDRCATWLAPGGRIVFVAEAIYDDFYAPWGVRLDGLAAIMAVQQGWLELGFRRDFFEAELVSRGFDVEWEVLPWLGAYGTVMTADRREIGDSS